VRLSKKLPNVAQLYSNEEYSPQSSPIKIQDQSDIEPQSPPYKKDKPKTALEATELWSIPFKDIQINFDELIGIGAFGNVFKGKYFGTDVAVKEMLNADVEAVQNLIVREIETLK
jgi:hypothetical protein